MAFFSPENSFFKFTGRVLDVVVLSTMWLVCSLPIVTIGPATSALYYSCVKCLRWGEPGPYRNFIDAFKQNLKTGVGATLVAILAVILLYSGMIFFIMAAGTGEVFWGLMKAAYQVLLLLPAAALTVMFPLLSRFSFSMPRLLTFSVGLTFRHLPRLVLAGVINTALALAVYMGWYYGLMLFVPALDMLAISFLLEPVLRKYTPAEEVDGEAETPWYLRSHR